MTTAFKGDVHPVAAMFPMLDDDELNELADDIKANGQLYDIIVDADGVLIDGRNRLAACKIAKVKPRFATLNGTDPVAYILSSNIARRQMTVGQRAMVLVCSHNLCEPDRGTQAELARTFGIPQQRLSQAQLIAEHAAHLVDAVIAGTEPLSQAHEIAKKNRDDKETELERAAKVAQRMGALDDDLRQLVDEERISLLGAEGEQQQREQRRVDEQRDARALLTRIVDLAAPVDTEGDWVGAWAKRLGAVDATLATRTRQAGELLLALAESLNR